MDTSASVIYHSDGRVLSLSMSANLRHHWPRVRRNERTSIRSRSISVQYKKHVVDVDNHAKSLCGLWHCYRLKIIQTRRRVWRVIALNHCRHLEYFYFVMLSSAPFRRRIAKPQIDLDWLLDDLQHSPVSAIPLTTSQTSHMQEGQASYYVRKMECIGNEKMWSGLWSIRIEGYECFFIQVRK